MNCVNLIGRMTKDPEVRTFEGKGTNEDVLQAMFTLAVDRNQDEADFIRCFAYGKTAETIEQYCSKGMRVGVTGHMRTGSYQHKDGYTVYTTDVIVDRFDFADNQKQAEDEQPQRGRSRKQGAYSGKH